MSDPTAPVEGTPAPAGPETASTPEPWAPVMDRVSELAGSIDTRFSELEGRLPQPQPEPEPDPWAALTGTTDDLPTYFDQFGNPVELPQQQPALDPNALRQAVTAEIQQAVTPYQQQLQALQAHHAREQLYAEIPQLKDPAVAQATVDSMVQQMTASRTPPEHIEWALSNPQMIATFFKAAEAEKLAQGQAPAGEAVPSLEAAGGAVPGGNGEQPSYIQSAHEGAWQGLPPGLR